jgi:CheY-like chemotaxis protein
MATILVVDDEFGIGELLEALLEDDGHRVLTAMNGRHALERIAEAKPDLVISDLMMPVMDGAALIDELTRLDPEVRIIAASGLALNGSVIRPAGPGVRRFLPKPYSVHTLLSTLHEVLRE